MTGSKVLADLPKGFWIVAVVLALLGAGASFHTVTHHLEVKQQGSTEAFCNINAQVSCDKVAQSEYSEVFGTPVGVFGMAYFLSLLGLIFFAVLAGSGSLQQGKMQVYALMVLAGAGMSCLLAAISFFAVGSWCLVCIGVYVICFAQLGLMLFYAKHFILDRPVAGINSALSGFVVFFLLIVAVGRAATATSGQTELPKEVSAESAGEGILSETVLEVPVSPDDFRVGNDYARVQIVEFIDYQCPSCKMAADMSKQLFHAHEGNVQVVVKNFPLDSRCRQKPNGPGMHKFACDAALVTRCVGEKVNKYWEMHEMIFERQEEINRANLKSWSSSLGLSGEDFDLCMNDERHLKKIQDDIALGEKLGVKGTPTLFLNGRRILKTHSMVFLSPEIEKILKE